METYIPRAVKATVHWSNGITESRWIPGICLVKGKLKLAGEPPTEEQLFTIYDFEIDRTNEEVVFRQVK